jgi:uncharacterized protein
LGRDIFRPNHHLLMVILYLHGFASSAQSSKARYFAGRFAEVGVPLHTPDLNEPDFESLTVSRMVDQVAETARGLAPGPLVLMGSSLGAFVAWHAAARLQNDDSLPGVSHLVLLAPAVTFARDRVADFGPGVVDEWERTGAREFHHYAYDQPRRLRFDFYRDALTYQTDAHAISTPALVFQGTRDEVVGPEGVVAFFRDRPATRLLLLDDGHQLLDHLDLMWNETRAFLGL